MPENIDDVLGSIRAVVNYSMPSERADFERQGKPGGHVYEHLRRVEAWLNDPCTCEEGVGACTVCWERAKRMIGAHIRDHQGRVWTVERISEKGSWITLGGNRYWTEFESGYEILEPAPEEIES
jgi:hypothetical protein